VVANAYLPELRQVVPGGDFLFRGQIPDLTPNWYKQVRLGWAAGGLCGSALLPPCFDSTCAERPCRAASKHPYDRHSRILQVGRTIAVSVFIGTITRAVNVAMARFTQWRQARSRAKAVSQAELEESYKGPKFDLAVRYGQHMQVGGHVGQAGRRGRQQIMGAQRCMCVRVRPTDPHA
jgi:hypothetical protein